MINWIKKKENIVFVLMLLVGVGLAWYKYSFFASIIGFSIIGLSGFILAIIISRFL